MNTTLPVLDILEYGIPGFAVVLLWLGYRLLSKFQTEMIEVDVAQFGSPQIFDRWAELARSLIHNARVFMAISVVFFLGGLALAILAPGNQIIVSVAPSEPHNMRPVVTVQEDPVELDTLGKAHVDVKGGHIVRVRNSKLLDLVNSVKKDNDNLQSQLRMVLSQSEDVSPEAGF